MEKLAGESVAAFWGAGFAGLDKESIEMLPGDKGERDHSLGMK